VGHEVRQALGARERNWSNAVRAAGAAGKNQSAVERILLRAQSEPHDRGQRAQGRGDRSGAGKLANRCINLRMQALRAVVLATRDRCVRCA